MPDMVSGTTSESDAALLGRYLASRDVACPRCGYNLRKLTSVRCPECGEELQLTVGLVHPNLGAYVALVAACCVGLGGSALFGLVVAFNAPPTWWSEPAAVLMIVQLVVAGVALPLVLAKRKKLRARSLTFQWVVAMTMWLIVAGMSSGVIALFDD